MSFIFIIVFIAVAALAFALFLILLPAAALFGRGRLFVRRSRDVSAGGKRKRGKEGDVYVSSPSPDSKEKIVGKDMGEYVDYETVD